MEYFMAAILWLQRNSIIPVFVMFCVLAIWTYWPSRKDRVERFGHIPLDDDL